MESPWQPFPLAQPTHKAQPRVYAPDLAVRLICPDCQESHPNIVEEYSSGDLVCGSCGLVLGDRIIDDGREWRTFQHEDFVSNRSRVGEAHHASMDSSNLGTTIAFDDGGSGTSSQLRRTVERAALNDSPSERHVSKAMKDLSETCQRIELPKTVRDIAKQLYQRVEQEDVFPQRRRSDKAYQGTLAACILIACRQARVPRTFIEISKLTCVDKKDLARAFRVLEQAFNVKAGGARAPDDPADAGDMNPEHLLARYCNYLGIAHDMASMCRDVVKKMQKLEIGATCKPMTVAGSAIYFTGHLLGRPISIADVANLAGMKGAAMVTLYRSLYDMKANLVPREWFEDGRAMLDRLPLPSQTH